MLETQESWCWAIRYRPSAIPHQLENEIEKLLPGYLFYPEVEWPKYGCVPPESLPVLGAWRHPQKRAFTFLLEISPTQKGLKAKQARLYMFGILEELRRCNSEIGQMKATTERVEKRILRSEKDNELFKGGDHARAVRQLLTLSVIFTMLVNALSYYLRNLPPPELPSELMKYVYLGVVVFVHFLALLLLIVIALISSMYVIKYGLLLLRRDRKST